MSAASRSTRASTRRQRADAQPVVAVVAPAAPAAARPRGISAAAHRQAAAAAAVPLPADETTNDSDDDDDGDEPMAVDQPEGQSMGIASYDSNMMAAMQQQIAQLQAVIVAQQSQSQPQPPANRFAKAQPPKGCIQLYNGERGDKLDEWISRLNTIITTYSLTDQEAISFGVLNLGETALSWFNDLTPDQRDVIYDGESFTAALRGRFESVTTEDTARERLDRLQQGNRSVDDYISEFQRLRARVPTMHESDAVHVFRRGLIKELAFEVRKQNVKTVAHAIDLVARIGGLTANAPSTPNPHGRPMAAPSSASIHQMDTSNGYAANDMQQMINSAVLNAMRMQQPDSDIGLSTNVLSGNGNGGRFQRGGRNGGNRFGNRPARQLPAIPGVSPAVVQQRWDAKQCLRCGSVDHRAISCPNAIAAYGQGK